MRYFYNFAQAVLKTCTNIIATVPLEIMNEVISCLNCIPVATHQQKRSTFLYYFPLFSLAKKTYKEKRQICKTLPAIVQNWSKSGSNDKGKQTPHCLESWVTFGAMLLLRFVLYWDQQETIQTISIQMFLTVRCSIWSRCCHVRGRDWIFSVVWTEFVFRSVSPYPATLIFKVKWNVQSNWYNWKVKDNQHKVYKFWK
jgi:hypothetical protein